MIFLGTEAECLALIAQADDDAWDDSALASVPDRGRLR